MIKRLAKRSQLLAANAHWIIVAKYCCDSKVYYSNHDLSQVHTMCSIAFSCIVKIGSHLSLHGFRSSKWSVLFYNAKKCAPNSLNSTLTGSLFLSFVCPQHKEADGEFKWSAATQGYILSSFFYGYVLTQIPFGMLAKRYGALGFLGWGMLLNSVFAFVVPIAARKGGVFWLCVIRFIQGLGEGPIVPCTHAMLAKWIPPTERSRMGAAVYAGLFHFWTSFEHDHTKPASFTFNILFASLSRCTIWDNRFDAAVWTAIGVWFWWRLAVHFLCIRFCWCHLVGSLFVFRSRRSIITSDHRWKRKEIYC